MTSPPEPLSLAEHVCLVLVRQGATHGWQVGSLLAPEAELGRVWSLSRPLTYRALEQLTERRLLRRSPAPTGRSGGRDRQLLKATAAGGRASDAWLQEPVEHLREVRTELLVKLVLLGRAGLDVQPLLSAQQARFDERIATLTSVRADDDLVALWRRESARAVRRFLEVALDGSGDAVAVPVPPALRISARNQLRATVASITPGDVLSTVKARLADGQVVTAVITRESIEHLDLASGDEVLVVVKSTEVMVAKA